MKMEHQKEKKRFVLLAEDGERMGYLMYEDTGEHTGPGVVRATHTKVYPAYEGQGHATRLLDAMAEWAEAEGLKIYPACLYVAKMFQKYPEKYAAVMEG